MSDDSDSDNHVPTQEATKCNDESTSVDNVTICTPLHCAFVRDQHGSFSIAIHTMAEAYPVSDADEEGDSTPSSGLGLRLLGLRHAVHIKVLHLAHPACKAQDPSLLATDAPDSWRCAGFSHCNDCTEASVLIPWTLPANELSHLKHFAADAHCIAPQSYD